MNRPFYFQTEWISVYKIHPTTGSRLNYSLNIIDIPGFDDTRKRDDAIVDQIRHLFCSQGDDNVLYIEAVCFFFKASDAPLTSVQKFNLSSILSLFGKDIESNICTLITFANFGVEPPVLASLKESKLPHETTFTFNSSALFAENKDVTNDILSSMFWKLDFRSFEIFFKHIKYIKTASLCQTKDVLKAREQLKCIMSSLRHQTTACLTKQSELKQQLEILQRCKSDITNNLEFEYTVEETKQHILDLPPGLYGLNCLQCNVTCQGECRLSDDDEMKQLWAMDKEGKCRICPQKCTWLHHKRTPYVIKYVTEEVTKTYPIMKEKYEEAMKKKIMCEKYIEDIKYCVENALKELESKMNEMHRCIKRLKEIALETVSSSAEKQEAEEQEIDPITQYEEEEKQVHQTRTEMLKEFREMAIEMKTLRN